MVKITFYDSTSEDEEYLTRLLHGSGYRLRFVGESVSTENLSAQDEVISISSKSDVTQNLIEKLPKLRLIACRSLTYDNIALSATTKRGIVVSIVPPDSSRLKDYTEWRRTDELTANNIVNFFFGVPLNSVELPTRKMGKLVVVRHSESEWNALNQWTGTTDVHLSSKGFHEASLLGRLLKDIKIDYAYSSEQIRSLETLESLLDASQQFNVPYTHSAAINERDYGQFTGKNKWEVKTILGDDIFTQLHRSWDYPIPGVETLKEVSERTLPFYKDIVLPRLKRGQNVLIVAHNNSIRSLMKYIERVTDKNVMKLEPPKQALILYDIDPLGFMLHKRLLYADK